MLIDKTLKQLRMSSTSPQRAQELGRMGYRQWLGGLPGRADYETEALIAYLLAKDLIETNPAIAVFCDLICDSLQRPLQPLNLTLPKPRRRGGARERRRVG